nr:YdeI/OmpD-associated family protein [uncultured Rhodoferax sp.]
MTSSSRMTREPYPMPEAIRAAMAEKNLTAAYEVRPPYQRNDYIGWITRAKLPATQHKRLAQMLAELAAGNAYMKMPYRAKGPRP